VHQAAAAFGSLPKLCCSLLEFSPHTRGTCLRQGRKTKDDSRSVTCAAACLGCVSMSNGSDLVTRVTQCLEGHWVNMRPGAAVMAHLRRRMAVGCHRPLAQRGTSCCEVTRASSASLRGGECFRLLAFSHEPGLHLPPPLFLPQKTSLFGRSKVRTVGCGGDHPLAVTEAGELWAWGLGEQGRLGLNDEQRRLVPTAWTRSTLPTHPSQSMPWVTAGGALYT
jgi:hypothetical protein